jgi:catechol 2,3-dioxygenase-like lactoylglutathione lyase family enzyme
MHPKSVSGLGFYVNDIDATAQFYATLGFRIAEQTDGYLKVYLNWFWLQFNAVSSESKPEFQAEAQADVKGAGLYINISVDNVDEFYQSVLGAGMRPSSEPRDWPWGHREFVIRDPDGYKLVLFQKK